ncbi:hypothetical protein O159_27580 [Leifsonia xyli subsp. cynodontis DSM 46306]|jgi:hypothetical protein|uniref:FHA domain-containing protein n=1 Tax=Leifsonia xyli subsp. cynodontis DSM 46306 TaxID=1389489 RepID=U3PG45_LEIXC|nr:FHA domain-containing protein [Leifsonia xyli]AGW42648.1 hypothetical protein O159_27580 [Leifsonia xyli subsp. cynodontis DSM 46306]
MSELWGLELCAPRKVAIARDRSADATFQVQDRGSGILQLAIGGHVAVRLGLVSGAEVDVLGALLGEAVYDGVVRLARLSQPPAETAFEAECPGEDAGEPVGKDLSAVGPTGDSSAGDGIAEQDGHPAAAEDLGSVVLADRDFTTGEPWIDGDPGADDSQGPGSADRTIPVVIPASPVPAPLPPPDFAATVVSAPLPAAGDLDATIVGGWFAAVPAYQPRSASPNRRSHRPARIRVTDAAGAVEHELAGVMYVGRRPSLPAEADERRSSLVAVGFGSGTVEETHAQLTAGDGLVLVRDLWSAGGTMVEQPNGAVFRLSPGEQIPVARGARILLGDGVVLETVG